jgi:hypothetical protein
MICRLNVALSEKIMRATSSLFAVLIVVLCAGCQSNRIEPPTRPNQDAWKYVCVRGSDKWYALSDLESKARTYLLEHKAGFEGTAREVMFWINGVSQNELVMIHYSSGFGRSYWSVTIDKAGQVGNVESGIFGEGPLDKSQK